MIPVYTAILPPGMHHALTSLTLITLTSHAHFGRVGAEGRASAGMRRWDDRAHARGLRRVAVEHALRARSGEDLGVGLLGAAARYPLR